MSKWISSLFEGLTLQPWAAFVANIYRHIISFLTVPKRLSIPHCLPRLRKFLSYPLKSVLKVKPSFLEALNLFIEVEQNFQLKQSI